MRIQVEGYPQHIIQRGNNRGRIFFHNVDYTCYLNKLYDASCKYHCAIHAYVLMTNHVHLLVTPYIKNGLAKLMQSTGSWYVPYINRKYKRTGTLWEGRYKSSLIENDNYLLTCYRYIELNPVRAGLVSDPSNYPWSSYRANALGDSNPLIIQHDLYQNLGKEKEERQENYRQLFVTTDEGDKFKQIQIAIEKRQNLS